MYAYWRLYNKYFTDGILDTSVNLPMCYTNLTQAAGERKIWNEAVSKSVNFMLKFFLLCFILDLDLNEKTTLHSWVQDWISVTRFGVYSYNGRATAASPATGSKAAHNKELKNLLDEFCVL